MVASEADIAVTLIIAHLRIPRPAGKARPLDSKIAHAKDVEREQTGLRSKESCPEA